MASNANTSNTGDTLLLSGVIDYETVLDLDRQGRVWLNGVQSEQCQVDLASITYSSSVGIALLLGWLRLAQELKKKLRILHLPETMVALAKVGGLDEVLS